MKPGLMTHLDKQRLANQYPMPDSPDGANYGLFLIEGLLVMSSGTMGEWEHVSVSRQSRCPTWPEMCKIKDLFWGEEETVIQYHPPKSEYVNIHPYCLHLWKPPFVVARPPSILVGIKGVKVEP